jgi:hypothetical protein
VQRIDPNGTIEPHELVLAPLPASDRAVPGRIARRFLPEEASAGHRPPHLADEEDARACDVTREVVRVSSVDRAGECVRHTLGGLPVDLADDFPRDADTFHL